ncbi:MAG TPA: D-alanyl-D-alanine carboxypeptidase/D-alanyl-D-alanine-endopeptidase, partial [Candidatus Dormibacteraeota bacterium]|nr:D-alanyl-D-alanine carboxypeptidase/D-alanyl-D-alanine-endopeptidase [Candidatus Dormibacteraeota bacterium]
SLHYNNLRQPILALLLALFATGAQPRVIQAKQQRARAVSVPAATQSPALSGVSSTQTARSAKAAAVTDAPRTLAELQTRIGEIIRQPRLAPGIFALKIVSLDTGRVIYEENANKLLRPASNMKIYTVSAALDRLGPEYRYITSVYARERPEENGTLKGNLIIYGRGDPSIAARFHNGDYFKGINNLAARILAAGVKRIKGDLIGDESYFNGAPLGGGWEWEDLQWWYGAEVSALTVNDNSIDLTVKPGARVGAPCVITTGPPAPFLSISNRALTGPRGTRSDLSIYRGPGQNVLEITGSLPLGDEGFSGSVAVPDPALAFVSMLRDALEKRGVKIEGRVRTVNARSGLSLLPRPLPTAIEASGAAPLPRPVEITNLRSPPLSLIAAHTLKPSQNLYTELILRSLGVVTKTSVGQTDEEAGLEAVRKFLGRAGVDGHELVLNDGSGLSRNDMVTANASGQLLTFMAKHRYAAAFRDALPIAGVDGTLRDRMKGTPAEGNLRAKTGTLSSVASLSGYVTSAASEHFVFSMMLNNYAEVEAVRKDSIDAIGVLLASFAGRSQ